MAWFRKDKKPLTAQDRREVPTDVFDKCQGCGEILYRERLAQNLNVCPNCAHHIRISSDAYLSILLDSDTFEEGKTYWVEVSDSQGRLIHKQQRELSGFGTLHDEVVLDRYQAFGTAGQASRIRPLSLEAMFVSYADGSLNQVVH